MEEVDEPKKLSHSLSPDTLTFLGFLGGKIETFSFMKRGSRSVIKGYGIKFLDLAGFATTCNELWNGSIEEAAFEPHVCLNLTNLRGRKRLDIAYARVLCVDLDEPITLEYFERIKESLNPHLVVQSSPGKYHFYWKCDLKLEEWELAQGAFALKLGGDLNLMDRHHTIRIPGFERVLKDGVTLFTPTIIYRLESADPITMDSRLAELGMEAVEKRKERDKAKSKRANKVIDTHSQTGEINVEVLEAIPKGERNDSLYAICKNYVIKGNGQVTEESTIELGFKINETLGLDAPEVLSTAKSAFQRGEEYKAKRLERKEENKATMRVHTETLEALGDTFNYNYGSRALSINRFTDEALIERVLQRFHGHLIRTPGGVIYAFDDKYKVWRQQKHSKEILNYYVGECCIDVLNDPKFIEEVCGYGESAKRKLNAAQMVWLSNAKSNTCIDLLCKQKNLPEMNVGDFDANEFMFYCENGALDMLTGEIRDANAEDYLLRKTKVVFNPKAKCPYWINFLEEIFAENDEPEEMVRFTQEMFGYTISGSTDEQCMFIHNGDTCAGKSTVLSVLWELADDYACLVDSQILAKSAKSFMHALNRVGAKIEGKRCVIVDDLPPKVTWDDGTIKTLTDDTILTKRLYEEERDAPNRSKMHIGCNDIPNVQSSDPAIHRRLPIIRYMRSFPFNPAKKREIRENVEVELSGILNWALDGLRRKLANPGSKIKYPAEVVKTTIEYEEDSIISQFNYRKAIDDTFEVEEEDPKAFISLETAYKTLISRYPSIRDTSPNAVGMYLSKKCAGRVMRQQTGGKRERFYQLKFKKSGMV